MMVKEYYTSTWKVTWEDGTVSTHEMDSKDKRPYMRPYQGAIAFNEFNGAYRGGIIRSRTFLSFEVTEELNFRRMKKIEYVGSTKHTITHETHHRVHDVW